MSKVVLTKLLPSRAANMLDENLTHYSLLITTTGSKANR